MGHNQGPWCRWHHLLQEKKGSFLNMRTEISACLHHTSFRKSMHMSIHISNSTNASILMPVCIRTYTRVYCPAFGERLSSRPKNSSCTYRDQQVGTMARKLLRMPLSHMGQTASWMSELQQVYTTSTSRIERVRYLCPISISLVQRRLDGRFWPSLYFGHMYRNVHRHMYTSVYIHVC